MNTPRAYTCAKCTSGFPTRQLFNSHLDKEGHRIAALSPPRRFIFAVDSSNSMQGEKIELAKLALARTLIEINDKDVITILRFAEKPQILAFEQPKRKISALLYKIEANGLRSNIRDAISVAVSLAKPGTHVVILTDGRDTSSKTSLDDLCEKYAKMRHIRVTICGIGLSSKAAAHLQEIALCGAHCCELRVIPPSAEDIVTLMHTVFARRV